MLRAGNKGKLKESFGYRDDNPKITSDGCFGRVLRWFAHSPRGSWGCGCPEGTIWCWFGKGLVKGACGEILLRQIAAGGCVIRKEQWALGTSLPYLQTLQSNTGLAVSLYSWLPGEGKQGGTVPTPPAIKESGWIWVCLLAVQDLRGFLYSEQVWELTGVGAGEVAEWNLFQELVRKASQEYEKIWKNGWGKGKGSDKDNGTVFTTSNRKKCREPKTKGKGVSTRTVTGKESYHL